MMNTNENQGGAATNTNRGYDIPIEGSLGLLALGAKGLDEWRKKKAEANQREQQSLQDSGNGNEEK